jgi:SAM-dependent methyltransferase
MQAPNVPARLRRTNHLSWFAHMGAVYLFHDLYGYLMEMSPDIADLIEAFAGGADTEQTIDAFRPRFTDADPMQFVEVLLGHAVLLDPDDNELDMLWAYVPIKGKWNVWQRRPTPGGDRLTLWTAWGERPVQQLFLDADETRMWDAIDGDKRLVDLRHVFDKDKLLALVRRLVHSDVQALKLSMLPWSAYAKRPSSAPPYLASTMPYRSWKPGTPVPAAVDLGEYHREQLVDAEEQFDHQETTLSHLLRVPHPGLHGKTYGQALIDALVARGLLEGRLRVLELGAGLGYLAKDAIARLRATGRTVEYTIVELAPALAAAQRERLGSDATWIAGDALEVTLPDASFDLIISNEMVGDLPAKRLSRLDIGLALDGTGQVDRARLATYSPAAAELGVFVDDAPEPFYLQTGAIELVARIARWLAPGGTAVVTEFGYPTIWPKLSSHLDHPELSTHFGHLQAAARGAGLDANVQFVIDLLDFDREQKGLATTRSQYRALRALAAHAGVDLPKIGFTPELLDQAVAGKLDLTTVGDLRWDKIEDRLMGLVPHEFKALLATKPR